MRRSHHLWQPWQHASPILLLGAWLTGLPRPHQGHAPWGLLQPGTTHSWAAGPFLGDAELSTGQLWRKDGLSTRRKRVWNWAVVRGSSCPNPFLPALLSQVTAVAWSEDSTAFSCSLPLRPSEMSSCQCISWKSNHVLTCTSQSQTNTLTCPWRVDIFLLTVCHCGKLWQASLLLAVWLWARPFLLWTSTPSFVQ